MPYNLDHVDRICEILDEKYIDYIDKKMMGGIVFMVKNKMCCGVHYDKKRKTDMLMARIGEDEVKKALEFDYCHEVKFTKSPMKHFVFIEPEGFYEDDELEAWLDLCLKFNPEAKSSKGN